MHKEFNEVPSDYFPGTGELHAIIHTNLGVIDVKLFEHEAPKTVANFIRLALGKRTWQDLDTFEERNDPYYDGVIFHRVIPGFMIQGGDRQGTGRGGPGYRFADEFGPGLRHDKPGILSMANAGPGTDGSQFFLTFVATPWLDGKHTIFGVVEDGMDTLKALEERGSRDGRPSEPLKIEKATWSES